MSKFVVLGGFLCGLVNFGGCVLFVWCFSLTETGRGCRMVGALINAPGIHHQAPYTDPGQLSTHRQIVILHQR